MISICSIIILVASLITGCGTVEEEKDVTELKIGIITDSIEGDNAFLTQAVEELEMLADEYGFETTHIEAEDSYAWFDSTQQLCDQGYDLMIGMGWQGSIAFSALIDSYPDTTFAVIDVSDVEDGIKGVTFDVVDGTYVLGVMMATAFPEAEVFGYIGNYDDDGNYEYQYGYTQGILSVNPDAEIVVEFADTYGDVDITYEIAESMARDGIQVIMGSVSSSANEGIYQAALDLAEEGIYFYTSGVSVDQTREENPYIIGGVTKETDIAVRMILEDYIEGTFTYETEELAGDAFGVLYVSVEEVNYQNTDIITDEVITSGKEAYELILSGEIVLEVQ